MKKGKVLVTGAKGFIGSEIVKFLEKEYARVFTIENKGNSRKNVESATSFDAFAVDITDRDAVLRLEKIGVIDAVVHSAGLAHQFGGAKRDDFQRVNVAGTGNVLELAGKLKVKHFVLISSVSVYGHFKIFKNKEGRHHGKKENNCGGAQIVDETAECEPDDFYGESKLNGENLALQFCRDNDIKLTILRLATVIGEEDKGNFLRLIRTIDRRRFVWIGKGENYKSLLHREDVARACVSVLKNEKNEKNEKAKAKAEIFNVSANFLTMRAVVELIGDKLEKKIPRIFIPAFIVKRFFSLNYHTLGSEKIKRLEKTISKWLTDDVYSAEKIKRVHGFEPLVEAKKAIEREVEWYLANK